MNFLQRSTLNWNSHEQLINWRMRSKTIDFLLSSGLNSCYLYSSEQLIQNYTKINNSLKNGRIAYSYKCNYSQNILEDLKRSGAHFEVSSEMEFMKLTTHGVPSSQMIVNAPVISDSFLTKLNSEEALVNAQSISQLEKIIPNCRTGLRLNIPGYKSRFGIELSKLPTVLKDLPAPYLNNIESLHIHLITPERNPDDYRSFFELLTKQATVLGLKHLISINIGGGYFSELHPDLARQFDNHVDPSRYIELFKTLESDYQLIIEPGALLTSNTISFCCQVMEIEDSRIQLSGSIYDILPTKSKKQLPYTVLTQSNQLVSGNCFGFTCMEDDVMIQNFEGPLAVGDWIEFHNIGAYAQNLRPHFIGPKAKEIRLMSND